MSLCSPIRISKYHNGPADISINVDTDILAVPNFYANTADFVKVKLYSTVTGKSRGWREMEERNYLKNTINFTPYFG